MKLNKSIFRVMGENKGQYIGMFFMVLLSSLLFVLFALAATNLSANKNAYFKDYVQGDLEFFSISEIENIDEIEQKFELKMEETLVKEYSYDGKTVRLFTPNDKVNITAVLDGRLPSNGEIALDPGFAKANGYEIGEAFYLGDKAYLISGYICLPNYAYIIQKEGDLVNNPNIFGIGVLNKAELISGSYLYSIKFNAPQSNIYEQAKPVKTFLNEQNIGILSWTYAKYDMKTNLPNVEVAAITAYSLILPPVFMLLSAVLVAVVLGRMIKNQMSVIGTLYALGYRKKEFMRHYMNYPLALGLTGGVVGGIIGMFGFKPLLDIMLDIFPMPIRNISYNPLFIILGAVLSVAILCLGTYIALNKVLGNSPVSLMKNEGKAKKLNAVEKKLRLGGMKFNNKFKVREQLRSLPRLAFLFVGVFAATALIMLGFILKSSLDYLINQEGNDTLSYEFEYVMNEPQTIAPPSGGEALSGLKFVPDFDFNSRFEIIGASSETRVVSLVDMKGNPISIDDEKAIISKTMARKYGLKVGDTISFSDIVYDKEHSVTITHIADTGLGDLIFVSNDRLNGMLGWENGAYNVIMSDVPLDIDEQLIYQIKTPENLSEALAEYMGLMNAILYGVAVIAAVIGLIIMYILASISIDENKGSISLMKVFGYKKKEVGDLVVNGSRGIVMLGFIVGVPLSFISLGNVLMFIFNLIKLTLEPRIDWYYILLGFVLIFLAFELSKALCVRKVDRVSMSEALKAQRE